MAAYLLSSWGQFREDTSFCLIKSQIKPGLWYESVLKTEINRINSALAFSFSMSNKYSMNSLFEVVYHFLFSKLWQYLLMWSLLWMLSLYQSWEHLDYKKIVRHSFNYLAFNIQYHTHVSNFSLTRWSQFHIDFSHLEKIVENLLWWNVYFVPKFPI